jgi:uncharacterized membrane protein YkoI
MKRTTMIAAAVGAAAVLGFGGTAMAASLDDDPRATTGLGAAASPSSTPSDDSATPSASPSSRSSDDAWASPSASASSASASSASGASSSGASSSGASSSGASSSGASGAAVSRAEAVAIAQAYLGRGTVREVESDDVRDVVTWKVEFDTDGGRREINVEKATGRVISDEFDDRNDGGDDDSGRHGDDSGRGGGDDSGHGRNGHGRNGDDD